MTGRKKPWRSDGPESAARVNLTALLDVLSNIIFFLLVSWGAQAMLAEPAAKVNLAKTTSELSLGRAITVSASLEAIFVEDEPVVQIEQSPSTAQKAQKAFSQLEDALRRVRAERLAKNERPSPDEDLILFVGDKRLDFQTIDRVMKTCQKAGFTRFRFAAARDHSR